jgi:hypothetical protein
MKLDFLSWWSIISTILNIIFLIVAIWQYFEGQKQKERNNAQVKVWMNDANGIHVSLLRIVHDNLAKRYSSTDDIANTIWAIASNAFSLYQSLYEERAVTEKEYKERQKEMMEQIKKNQSSSQGQDSESDEKKLVSN